MKPIAKRILDLAYKYRLSHISSALNVVDVLVDIYEKRSYTEPVVLGNAHAALALYAVLEHYGIAKADDLIHRQGVHQVRDLVNGIYVSGGSLGQAETIAVGIALADRTKLVHLITSDGACAEGAVWESLALADKEKLSNLRVYVIANGWAAYQQVDRSLLNSRLSCFKNINTAIYSPVMPPIDWLQGLSGHYVVMSDDQYREVSTW